LASVFRAEPKPYMTAAASAAVLEGLSTGETLVEEVARAFLADGYHRFWFVDQLHALLKQCNGSLAVNFKSECAKCHQKPSTASERFKERHSVTIREYCLRLRMEYARDTLDLDPTVAPGQLARRLGYGCGTAFSRVFKAYWAVSPREYAQQALARSVETPIVPPSS
jgi:AraC-like DNA-binding protein